MGLRALFLPAILVAIYAVAMPRTAPATDELPQAPAPRMKKTTAELLVGRWKLVDQQNMPQLPPEWDLSLEFTSSGEILIRAKGPLRSPPPLQTGTYRLEQNTIRMTIDPPAEPRDRAGTIESVTEEKLILLGPDEPERKREVHKRIW